MVTRGEGVCTGSATLPIPKGVTPSSPKNCWDPATYGHMIQQTPIKLRDRNILHGLDDHFPAVARNFCSTNTKAELFSVDKIVLGLQLLEVRRHLQRYRHDVDIR